MESREKKNGQIYVTKKESEREKEGEERDTCKSAKPSYSVSARTGIGRERKEIK